MQKVFNNPEISFQDALLDTVSASAMILVEAKLRAARIEGFRAGHHCQKEHPEIPLDIAIKRWENDEPSPARKIY